MDAVLCQVNKIKIHLFWSFFYENLTIEGS